MALQANAVFKFTGYQTNQDGTVTLFLTCAQPGSNMPGAYTVTLTAANITTIAAAGTQAQQLTSLQTIVTAALVAQYRTPTTTIDTRLNTLAGVSFTVA